MSQNEPTHLRIDTGGQTLVVSGERPHLSWRLPGGWDRQDGYVVTATVNGEALPPVEVTSLRHLFVPWPWEPLRSRAAVRWSVRCRRDAVVSAPSTEHVFEAGLLGADWTASWISPVEPDNTAPGTRPAHVLEGGFTVEPGDLAGLERARLYVTALGVYEVHVNGHRVGDEELAPGSTSYAETLHAQAHDLAPYLAAGQNTVEILLSDGWYRGRSGAWRTPAKWGTRTGARLEVHLQHPGGVSTVTGTGAGWTSRCSAITRADLMDGQTTDLRRGPGERRPALVDAVAAPAPDVSPAPPVRVIETVAPRSVTRTRDGAVVVDFGQNASGRVRLTDLGPAGTRTVIDHGEHVDSRGELSTRHLDSARPGEAPIPFVQRDEVVAAGVPGETFEPRHTVHGFRYARIARDRVSENDGADLDPATVSMQVLHTDLPAAGTFACSDADLTRLHEVARWSFRGNAVDVPTDCPTRERLGWTGDYQVFISTAVMLFDVDGFSRKWLRSVRDDQLPDGRIVNASPDPNHLKAVPDVIVDHITGSAGWGDAIVHVPWTLYETYGDDVVLAENWEAMTRWVGFALRSAATTRHPSRVERSAHPQPHEQYLWDGTFHWGEWLEPKQRGADGFLVDPVAADPRGWFAADKGEVGTAYLYRSTRTLARIAGVLGRTAEQARYAELAERVRDAWRTEFLRPDGSTTAGTQAASVRALAFDLVPQALRAATTGHLAARVHDADGHLTTGFLATTDLLPVLADTGHADLAYAVLARRSYPSWLAMLDRGATTIWEDWEGIDADGHATASLNHYSKGSVVRFFYSHTLGLRQTPGSVAWEQFVVEPVPGPALTWARGSFDGPRGVIGVEWRVDGADFVLDVEVPSGSSAELRLPDGSTARRGPGRTSLRCPVPVPAALAAL